MWEWKSAVMFVLGWCGVLFGVVLGYIAKDELEQGKNYFILGKNVLLVFLGMFSAAFFVYEKNYVFLIGLAVLMIFLWYVIWKKKLAVEAVLSSILSFFVYFISGSLLFLEVFISVLFIYGLFLGTLFHQQNFNNKLNDDNKKKEKF
ncbi:hypothetical protein HYX11_00335 [Candidatus Woesearchaeota archaeon]|nr:hypothetical protein [Candidatus Woesearchaeota archaeon]